ncbi:MAG TPA: aldo/keto reductase [Daejeonella sp.]|nr:aldo/keto reductase [Daejeonella sp.]
MEKRKLGNTDLWIAPIAFGGNVLGWTINEEASFNILDAFSENFNLVDTADVYSRWKPENSGGESETIIGNWLKSRNNRDKVIIATKVGADMGEGKSLKKNYIIKSAENSLKRLQTDYIDLYQTHYDDLDTPIEETLEAYDSLIKAGKIRWIGASNMSAERLKLSIETAKANNLPVYQSFQPEYNLYARENFEHEFEKICLEHQIGVITYYSLASGFLTGKYRTEIDLHKSVRGQGIKKYLNDRGFKILAALDQVSAAHNTQPAAVALAWLLSRPAVSAPITSLTRLTQLPSLIDAANLKLSDGDISLLDMASAY